MRKHNKLSLNCTCEECEESRELKRSITSEQLQRALITAGPQNLPGPSRIRSSRSSSSSDSDCQSPPSKKPRTPTPRTLANFLPECSEESSTESNYKRRKKSFLSIAASLEESLRDRSPTPNYGSEWDSDGVATIAHTPTKSRNDLGGKRPRPSNVVESSSSDSDFEPIEKKTRPKKPQPKKPRPKNHSTKTTRDDSIDSLSSDSEANDDYHTMTRTSESNVSFLSHTVKKTSTKYICPFVTPQKRKCGKDFTTSTALKKHFEREHNMQKNVLQKPVITPPNNWRRIQNNNKRFHVTTVKMKLCSLLVGGKSVVDENRQRLVAQMNRVQQSPSTSSLPKVQQKENEMARQVFEIMEHQAKELSKLAILFSYLVYYKIYRFIETNDETVTDMAFKQNIKWNLILLTFKKFQRKTKNSTIRIPKTLRPTTISPCTQ